MGIVGGAGVGGASVSSARSVVGLFPLLFFPFFPLFFFFFVLPAVVAFPFVEIIGSSIIVILLFEVQFSFVLILF